MAGAVLLTVELTTTGYPILLPYEIECSLLSNIELEPKGSPLLSYSIQLISSFLILMTHRLIFVSNSSSATVCYVPLVSIVHIFLPKKSIKSIFASPRLKFQLSMGSDGTLRSCGTLFAGPKKQGTHKSNPLSSPPPLALARPNPVIPSIPLPLLVHPPVPRCSIPPRRSIPARSSVSLLWRRLILLAVSLMRFRSVR
ncbi:hypothetical protein NL676_002377 [Syzygium grande]|nr:hypothetical protein NL676_002377 [Syzygium grande]